MIPAIGRNTETGAISKPELQKAKLKEVCQEFESLLTGYVFKSMRQSIMKADEPDQAGQIYEGMMDDMMSRELSRHGNGGMADLLYQQLLPLLEKRSSKDPA